MKKATKDRASIKYSCYGEIERSDGHLIPVDEIIRHGHVILYARAARCFKFKVKGVGFFPCGYQRARSHGVGCTPAGVHSVGTATEDRALPSTIKSPMLQKEQWTRKLLKITIPK